VFEGVICCRWRKLLKAQLKNGSIIPLEPVPNDWLDGAILEIAKKDEATIDLNAWAELERLCAEADPEDDATLFRILDEQREEGKRLMRRQLGLEPRRDSF